MKLPVVLPTYLCGECGIEMLLDRRPSEERVKGPMGPNVTVSCYTPQCPQKGVVYGIVLQNAPVSNQSTETSTAT